MDALLTTSLTSPLTMATLPEETVTAITRALQALNERLDQQQEQLTKLVVRAEVFEASAEAPAVVAPIATVEGTEEPATEPDSTRKAPRVDAPDDARDIRRVLPRYHLLGQRLAPGFEVLPTTRQTRVGIFSLRKDEVYSHLASKGHSASAEEYSVSYCHGFFLACANAAFAEALAEVPEEQRHVFDECAAILEELEESMRVRIGYLRMAKGPESTEVNRAFAELLREQRWEAGTEHLGSESLTYMHEEFLAAQLSALHAATAKRAASQRLAGKGKTENQKKTESDKKKAEDKKKASA